MAARNLLIFPVFISVLFGLSREAFGWGAYGHQQVNHAAVQIMGKSPHFRSYAACFTTNIDFITRLGITPDYDWKWLGTPPTDEALIAKKHQNDRYEHSLHFFEADSYAYDSQSKDVSRAD